MDSVGRTTIFTTAFNTPILEVTDVATLSSVLTAHTVSPELPQASEQTSRQDLQAKLI